MFDNTNNFLKGINIKPSKFFDGYIPLKEITYCIIIIYDNNFRKEIYGITNPWQFIKGIKKNPRVKTAYIKDENNP
jgi:hypothetical protein